MRVLLLSRFSLNFMSLAIFFWSRIPIPNFMKYYQVSVSVTRPQDGRRKADERTRSLLRLLFFYFVKNTYCRSQWPRGLRRRSAAARLLILWVRIPPGAWMFVLCECCVLSGRGLCDELITRPEESYRLWCVVECDLETS